MAAPTTLTIKSNLVKERDLSNQPDYPMDTHICPHRNSNNNIQFAVCNAGDPNKSHKVGFMEFGSKADWTRGHNWSLVRDVWNSNLVSCYFDYDDKIWPYSIFNPGYGDGTLYAIGHHEWPNDASVRKEDIKTLVWMKSNDDGRSWFTKSYSSHCNGGSGGRDRCFIIPKAGDRSDPSLEEKIYGFMSPSNVVYEDGYYYWAAGYAGVENTDPNTEETTVGSVLMRLHEDDLDDPTQTEIFDANRNWTKTHSKISWGNGGNQPFIFFEKKMDPSGNKTLDQNRMTALRWHIGRNCWIAMGRAYGNGLNAPAFGFTHSASLSNPQFDNNGFTYAVFDPSVSNFDNGKINVAYSTAFSINTNATNYENIGDSIKLWTPTKTRDPAQFWHCDLEFS